MTFGEESNGPVRPYQLLDLPDDVIFLILASCDLQSIGRLGQVSRRICHLVRQDCVWVWLKKKLRVVTNYCTTTRSSIQVPARQQCHIAKNWCRAVCRNVCLVHHDVRQLPWLQLHNDELWASYKNIVKCYRTKADGYLEERSVKTLRGHHDDVTRFVCKDDVLVTGARDGSICAHSAVTGQRLVHLTRCHRSDIHAVDCHRDVVVSGSRDGDIKIWNLSHPYSNALLHTIVAHDRVWSVAMNPSGRTFAVGTAGINHVPPLRVWDIETARLVSALGLQYKNGAGVLDIQYESQNVLMSCGYDTYIRLWDLRKSYTNCVSTWEEPFDSTVYCIKSDKCNMFVSGTARHGMVRLWDKRSTKQVQMYYTGRSSSPVYSLAFDSTAMYVALDKGIHMLDFMWRVPH